MQILMIAFVVAITKILLSYSSIKKDVKFRRLRDFSQNATGFGLKSRLKNRGFPLRFNTCLHSAFTYRVKSYCIRCGPANDVTNMVHLIDLSHWVLRELSAPNSGAREH